MSGRVARLCDVISISLGRSMCVFSILGIWGCVNAIMAMLVISVRVVVCFCCCGCLCSCICLRSGC